MERRRLRITGTVQGVGFRPFISRLAAEIGLTGTVGNDDDGAWCEVQGSGPTLDRFFARVGTETPPLARIETIDSAPASLVVGEAGFVISTSATGQGIATASVPPDIAPCGPCLAEIADPSNRRHGYAFTCCTDCGPRYTVVRGLPYDRERTSMADFALCAVCAGEYQQPNDRRYHSQATCCAECGPQLALTASGNDVDGDPMKAACDLLGHSAIVAVKGVGGYQLMCRGDDDDVVSRLRSRKHREEKPFALLVSSVEAAGHLVELDDLAERALAAPEAPIVLAPRLDSAPVAEAVAPDTRLLGVMLPATPLHALLVSALPDFPLVCTSGNASDEPIVIDDAEVGSRLGDIADAVLTHDRRIERRADDSVGHVVRGEFQLLRRGRGFAPRPIRLPGVGTTVLAVGAELKSTVCLAVGADAHLSVHLGDLEHPAALTAFEAAVADLLAVTRARPELVVHDLHPEYLSTKFAQAAELAPTLGVQHHHAHLVACLIDNRRAEPVIGVTFDGLGWGADGTLWGGEFLVGNAHGYDRAAHLAPVPMPGGGVAIREPWRMAVSWMAQVFGEEMPDLRMTARHHNALRAVLAQCEPARSMVTSSVGRLFDSVAALCGLVDSVSHEGQAAIRLEQAAGDTGVRYPIEILDGERPVVDPRVLVTEIVRDLEAGVDVAVVAGGFHRWVADMITDVSSAIRERTGLETVALSGGVFQNRLLVELVSPVLANAGFEVLHHRQVPPNDGGISLGQAAIGRAVLASTE